MTKTVKYNSSKDWAMRKTVWLEIFSNSERSFPGRGLFSLFFTMQSRFVGLINGSLGLLITVLGESLRHKGLTEKTMVRMNETRREKMVLSPRMGKSSRV